MRKFMKIMLSKEVFKSQLKQNGIGNSIVITNKWRLFINLPRRALYANLPGGLYVNLPGILDMFISLRDSIC